MAACLFPNWKEPLLIFQDFFQNCVCKLDIVFAVQGVFIPWRKVSRKKPLKKTVLEALSTVVFNPARILIPWFVIPALDCTFLHNQTRLSGCFEVSAVRKQSTGSSETTNSVLQLSPRPAVWPETNYLAPLSGSQSCSYDQNRTLHRLAEWSEHGINVALCHFEKYGGLNK